MARIEEKDIDEEEELPGFPALTRSTLVNVDRQRRCAPRPGTSSLIHDNTSPAYSWLLPGWLAEERIVVSGRLYRYYYDPSGRCYRTKHEVLAAWERSGLIAID